MIPEDKFINSSADLSCLVEACGFLPFFRNPIPGLSVEEHTPARLWFADDLDGPWEWKGPVIRETGCAYGKFFRGKAGFISREWAADFSNYRRDGYDFDARCEDGLAGFREKTVYGVLEQYPSLVSREWRKLSGIKERGIFDTVVTRLQMQGYVVTSDFVYAEARDGRAYGWGLARYAVSERFFGEEFSRRMYQRSPEESKKRMEEYLKGFLPHAAEKNIAFLIG